MNTYKFVNRHNGPRENDIKKMLETIKVNSVDELINETVPASIRLEGIMNLPLAVNEYQYISNLKQIASKNKLFRTYIGLGHYNTIAPAVILRNIFENPGWYTSYTPYQAEVSQGRLEALLNYQTVITELTGLDLANASLLDEATAGAEAMTMMYGARSRQKVKANANKVFVSNELFPQTIDLLKTRSNPLGIELVIGDFKTAVLTEEYFGAIIQYPTSDGNIYNYSSFVENAHKNEVLVSVAADILSLAILTPPGEWGADIVFGSTQRLGIPMCYGGPSAAFFATKDEYKRSMPGRIIGISVDKNGKRALRMALQTREQHIKRERATSNICTAQALLATMAGMYAVYHGPDGLKSIAERINKYTSILSTELTKLGYNQTNEIYFDTLKIELPEGVELEDIKKSAIDCEINFRYYNNGSIGISIDETTEIEDILDILGIFARVIAKDVPEISFKEAKNMNISIFGDLKRKSEFLKQAVFNSYHSETDLMRYIKKLEVKDISLNYSMIPLGSCTMKLNSAVELMPLSWPEFTGIHPYVPNCQAKGYLQIIEELDAYLSEITGFKKMSFQPNSGAAGEYAGLMVIRAYHLDKGNANRNIAIIPSSAHGTNPASAAMAGMEVIVVKCDEKGNIDINDLKAKVEQYKNDLSCAMITYPSTHGVFEEGIREIIKIIHENGGLVYMDGANMNAQVGLTSPGFLGADVCHLNLHKTFAIPHGGGGPGMGPIGVAEHLVKYLPKHSIVETGGEKGITAISATPYGSPLVSIISYGYIKLLGAKGLKQATEIAILNANYIKTRLEKYYPILYTGTKGRCAHEMILDCNEFKRTANIEVIDIAKRLMDYGFHAPTVAFPVHGTLMVEPTESEPLMELDRFCDAMILIRKEIDDIIEGKVDKDNNTIKNAPHTLFEATSEEWKYPYSREKAVYPMEVLKDNKYWPTVSRIDDAYGDRNLFCSCQA